MNNCSLVPLKMPIWFYSLNKMKRTLDEKCLNDISLTTDQNSKTFYRYVPHNAVYQNCLNGFAPLKKMALDKNCLKWIPPPETLV